jgi:signal transduction histidine kinase
MNPSLANRLRIGFAICFALLTAMAVIGVGRFIQQRQDYENSIARSYQVEIAARSHLARGEHPAAAQAAIAAQVRRRQQLQDSISGDTRDTALLVAAGLIAGLTAALLLFSGLIASIRRPLEELVEAAGQLAAGDRSARVKVGGLSETATLGAAFNEMADELEQEASRRDQLDRSKDEFVLTASHELRSPLTSVQGFAELLMLEREKLSPKQAETVEIILDNSRHLVRLLNDLLDLARSDAGRLAIAPKPTEVAPLIDDAVRTMRAQTESASQELTQQVEPGLPQINAEADRIRQILVNLLTNAHEYCPEEASIRVTAARIGAEVEIAVSDNGPGMAADQVEHIFERFTRGDAGLTQRVGGTGLGLAISKSLVELHGGTIGVTSTPGKGSTFRIRLPALATTAAPATDAVAKEAR